MRLTVIGSNVLAKPVEETIEKEDIIIEKSPTDLIRAEVKEIGDGFVSSQIQIPMKVRPSSFIWFDPRDAKIFPVNEETWYIVRQDNILVVEEDK